MSYIHNFPHWCYLQRDTRWKVYFFRKLHMSTLNLILTSILTQIRTPTFTLNLFLTFMGFEVWPWPWTWPWTRPGVGSGLGSRFRFRFWHWLRLCPQPGTRLFVSNRPTLIRIRTPTSDADPKSDPDWDPFSDPDTDRELSSRPGCRTIRSESGTPGPDRSPGGIQTRTPNKRCFLRNSRPSCDAYLISSMLITQAACVQFAMSRISYSYIALRRTLYSIPNDNDKNFELPFTDKNDN